MRDIRKRWSISRYLDLSCEALLAQCRHEMTYELRSVSKKPRKALQSPIIKLRGFWDHQTLISKVLYSGGEPLRIRCTSLNGAHWDANVDSTAYRNGTWMRALRRKKCVARHIQIRPWDASVLIFYTIDWAPSHGCGGVIQTISVRFLCGLVGLEGSVPVSV